MAVEPRRSNTETALLINPPHYCLPVNKIRSDKRKVSKSSNVSEKQSHNDNNSGSVAASSSSSLSTLFSLDELNAAQLEKTFSRESGTSWWGGITIMANVCLGMALLNFPRAIAQAGGLVVFSFLFSTFVVLIIVSLGMTAYSCRYYACVNYADMVITSCGPVLGYLCKLCLLLETMGNCIVKLVVFADQLDRIINIIRDSDTERMWYNSRQFVMPLVTTCTILPFCLMKNFQLFKYTSIVGILAAIYIAVIMAVGRYFTGVELPAQVEPVTGPYEAISILPLLVYAFHGHIEAPVVFSSMRHNRIFYFMRMVYGYLIIAVFSYVITAVYGYLTFGRFADEDLLLSYPNDDWVVNTAVVLIILKLFTSFPVVFYVLRSVVDDMCRRQAVQFLPNKLQNSEVRRIVQTIGLFSICVLIATLLPNMKNAIHLIGGISCNLAFTFPGLCFMNIHIQKDQTVLKHRIRIILGAIFVVIGMFLTGANTSIAFYAYLSQE